MPYPIESIERFTELIVKGKLLNKSQAELHLSSFQSAYLPSCRTGNTLTSWIEYLIKNDVLTCWQCSKLRNGQFIGFFLKHYKFLDYLCRNTNASIFLAHNEITGEVVRLLIKDTVKTSQDQQDIDFRGPISFEDLGPI